MDALSSQITALINLTREQEQDIARLQAELRNQQRLNERLQQELQHRQQPFAPFSPPTPAFPSIPTPAAGPLYSSQKKTSAKNCVRCRDFSGVYSDLCRGKTKIEYCQFFLDSGLRKHCSECGESWCDGGEAAATHNTCRKKAHDGVRMCEELQHRSNSIAQNGGHKDIQHRSNSIAQKQKVGHKDISKKRRKIISSDPSSPPSLPPSPPPSLPIPQPINIPESTSVKWSINDKERIVKADFTSKKKEVTLSNGNKKKIYQFLARPDVTLIMKGLAGKTSIAPPSEHRGSDVDFVVDRIRRSSQYQNSSQVEHDCNIFHYPNGVGTEPERVDMILDDFLNYFEKWEAGNNDIKVNLEFQN